LRGVGSAFRWVWSEKCVREWEGRGREGRGEEREG